MQTNESGQQFYTYKEKPVLVDSVTPIESAQLTKENIASGIALPTQEIVSETKIVDGIITQSFYKLSLAKHWGVWSLLPAIVAIALCWLTREPVTSLFAGILSGAFLLQRYDVVDQVLLTSMSLKVPLVLCCYTYGYWVA